jgi:hypothetical protein
VSVGASGRRDERGCTVTSKESLVSQEQDLQHEGSMGGLLPSHDRTCTRFCAGSGRSRPERSSLMGKPGEPTRLISLSRAFRFHNPGTEVPLVHLQGGRSNE